MQVSSNKDINIEGTEIIIINTTNISLCSIGILLLVKRIDKHIINIVMNRAIPAYLDCSEPRNTSLKFVVVVAAGILYIYSNMIERKIKNDNHINIYL
uniref:Uncharacterized protein n=1 Tax=viral metagenome TaxID=1070528 RepID=A0A6C0I8X2_9ZZZZ